MQFLALTSFGIETLLADEIRLLGIDDVTVKPEGVYFNATLEQGYLVCLKTRLASRVLLHLHSGEAVTKDDIYQVASQVDWPAVFECKQSFAIDFVGKSEEIRNSQFGALTVKDAIIDCFRKREDQRPNIDKNSADIRFQARLLKGRIALYLDFSGRSLFQRGYRQSAGSAPLKENLAAALVIRSGWLKDTSKPFIDPMCGSGTILIEAASMAMAIAPGLKRQTWGFTHWLAHDDKAWKNARSIAEDGRKTLDYQLNLLGLDLDADVLEKAKSNIVSAGLEWSIKLEQKDANELENNLGEKGTIVFNPPYGERIGHLPALIALFSTLGNIFKKSFVGWNIAIFSSSAELFQRLKLASFKRYKLKNGPLDCQLALYNIDERQASTQSEVDIDDSNAQHSAFVNRLKKNQRTLKSWLKQNAINCYRIYDADIPEYNVAIDVYDNYLVIQEYAAPKTIDASKAQLRLQEVVYLAPKILNVAPDNVSVKVRQKQKGDKQYQSLSNTKQAFNVTEYNAQLIVNVWDYLDTGLFLDHRKTRQLVAKHAKGKRLLNLFCYTGSVSVQAGLGGAAAITSVDMSNTYLNWAKENFKLNNLTSRHFQFIQADCLAWLKLNKETFDVIFIDPPSFSNSKRMDDTFDVQRDHIALLTDAKSSLADGGEIIFTNNKRNFKMDHEGLAGIGLQAINLSAQTLDKDFQRNKHIHNSWLITRR